MKKLLLILATLALAAIFLSGCKTNNPQLEGNDWYLVSSGDADNPTGLLHGTEISLLFASGEGTISGSAGCNSYFASYEISGNEIAISEIASTEMYCVSPEGIMDQEANFLSLLSNARSFEFNDMTLTIFCFSGQVLLFSTND